MTIREIDERMTSIAKEKADGTHTEEELSALDAEYAELAGQCDNLTAHDKVFLARHRKRPKIDDYISHLFKDFFEQKGDFLGGEDPSILGGIADFHGISVTVLGHRKGPDAPDAEALLYKERTPLTTRLRMTVELQWVTFISSSRVISCMEEMSDGFMPLKSSFHPLNSM